MSDPVDGPLVVTDTFVVPADELAWRFSRSSGPGGQGVNTADSRVELSWAPHTSRSVAALPAHLRDRLLSRLTGELVQVLDVLTKKYTDSIDALLKSKEAELSEV